MDDVDWRKILKAYIEHVGDSEGIDFLGMSYGLPHGLTNTELAGLFEVVAETVGYTEKYKRELLDEAARFRAKAEEQA